MQEVSLPSGAMLKIGKIPFAEAMALYEAVVEELKQVNFKSDTELASLYKELFCIGFSSPKIKSCLWKCFSRCLYQSGAGELKIDADTFEPEERRQDYIEVCMEVAKAAILPFVKSHSVKFFQILGNLQNSPELKSNPTPS